jgi:hypothetical protein
VHTSPWSATIHLLAAPCPLLLVLNLYFPWPRCCPLPLHHPLPTCHPPTHPRTRLLPWLTHRRHHPPLPPPRPNPPSHPPTVPQARPAAAAAPGGRPPPLPG